MKSTTIIQVVFLSLLLQTSAVLAQKGVWVPAGGNIGGFQIATGIYNNNMYVAGMDYKTAMPKTYIKKYNGVFWTTIVELKGFNNSISVLKEFNGELYVGGQFVEFEGVANANGLVKWNGKRWSAVGSGFSKTSFSMVRALEVYNNKLWVGGGFDSVAGIKVKNLAAWDGSTWTGGPSCESAVGRYATVSSLRTYNGDLYIGGTFEKVNSVNCSNVARFDGTNVYVLSNGNKNGTNSEVAGFEVFKSELYLYGYFSMLDTIPVNGVAKYSSGFLRKLPKEPGSSISSLKSLGNNLYSAGAGWQSIIEYFDGSKWDFAGHTELSGEGAKIEVYKNRLYVFSGFITSDSSQFSFESGSAMLIDASDACKVEGVVYNDMNKSCSRNSGEPGIAKRIIEINPIGLRVFTDSIGYFSMYLEKGTYSAKLIPYPYFGPTCTDSLVFSFTDKGQKTDTLWFGSFVKDTIFDGYVKISSTAARSGFPLNYFVYVENKGTAAQNCTLKVTLDNNVSYKTVRGKPYTRRNGNVLEWDLNPLKAGEIVRLEVNGVVVAGTKLGIFLTSFAEIIPTKTDGNMKNNYDTTYVLVRGSFDPNDKQVYPLGKGANGAVGPYTNQTLRYTIRFQNTGTDTAFNVTILDSLSNNLEPETFALAGTSHACDYQILPGNVLSFNFPQILLPDSNINEPSSHGFVSFTISPKKGLALGSKVMNNAYIYFDFNDPVKTNTTLTTFDYPASVTTHTGSEGTLRIYPNPGTGLVNVAWSKPIGDLERLELVVTDLRGKMVMETVMEQNTVHLDLSHLPNSVYLIKLHSSKGYTISGRYMKTF